MNSELIQKIEDFFKKLFAARENFGNACKQSENHKDLIDEKPIIDWKSIDGTPITPCDINQQHQQSL